MKNIKRMLLLLFIGINLCARIFSDFTYDGNGSRVFYFSNSSFGNLVDCEKKGTTFSCHYRSKQTCTITDTTKGTDANGYFCEKINNEYKKHKWFSYNPKITQQYDNYFVCLLSIPSS